MLKEAIQLEAGLIEFLDGVKRMIPVSLMSLVRENGRTFTAAPLPRNVKRGRARECFRNAHNLMARRPDLIYVEGYAHCIIPTLHAWCVTKDGVVVDPTWDDPQDCAYYGIAMRRDFVTRVILRNQLFGVLADPATAAKMHAADPATYRALEDGPC